MRQRILVLGLLAALIALLGVAEASPRASTAPATSADVPVVTGDLLNPLYFAHGAYVMQGVSDRDKIFAMPLYGVPELAFLPTAEGIDAGAVTWSVQVSPAEGISADIRNSILYIWGNNATWSGYGAVTLTATAGNAAGTVAIPVTVFRTDKTRTNAEGNIDYFVPWSPQLDINRILSVEEHMRVYEKRDSGLLDRSVRFSRWRRMEHVNGASVVGWLNGSMGTGLSQAAIWLQVDETFHELARIGCNAVYISRNYYTPAQTSPCPIEVFDHWTPGLSMTDEELAYVLNEAHLEGFYVLLVPSVAESPEGRYFRPADLDGWFTCYSQLVELNARIAERLGAESFSMANILMPEGFAWPSEAIRYNRWITLMESILREDVRPIYSGPVAYLPGSYEVKPGSQRILSFLEDVDIVGANSNFTGLTHSLTPTVQELTAMMRSKCLEYFVPIHDALQKPMFVNEGYTASYDGAIRGFDLSSGPPPASVYDGQEQADWYRAWFAVEKEFGFLFGFGWANWPFWPGAGGKGELGFIPRLKPAEAAIAQAYGAPDPFATICVDGDSSDWSRIPSRVEDSPTDSRVPDGTELISFMAASDDAYLYLAVVLSKQAAPYHTLEIDLDTDLDGQLDIPVGIFAVPSSDLNPTRRWMAILYEAHWSAHRGIIDIATSGDDTFFEMRVPRYFLGVVPSFSMRAVLVDGQRKTAADETAWLQFSM